MHRPEDPHPLFDEHVHSVIIMVLVLVIFFVILIPVVFIINWIKTIASFIF